MESTKKISVAAIVNRMISKQSGESVYPGIINKGAYDKDGTFMYTALGGAMLAWESGAAYLRREYQAEFWNSEPSDGGLDLRFNVEDLKPDEVLTQLRSPNSDHFEVPHVCIRREVLAELTTVEISGLQSSPVLTKEQGDKIDFVPVGVYRQPEPEDASNPYRKDMVRLFFVFDMHVDQSLWNGIEESSIIRCFTREEVALTNGGRRSSKLPDGAIIGDNIFIA
jgi:hypothetical protein